MTKKIILFFLILCSVNVFGQSFAPRSVQKANKERMKSEKKTHGYHSISIRESNDGFYCYIYSLKTGNEIKYGVLDKDFNEFFPCEYDDLNIIPPYSRGYHNFSVPAFNGQHDVASLFTYASPTLICMTKGDSYYLYTVNREQVSKFEGNVFILGNWVFTGIKDLRQRFVKEYNGFRKIVFTQMNKEDRLGMYKWDGTEIISPDHIWFTFNDHTNGVVNYANTYTEAGVGGFILEELTYKIPSVCSAISFDREKLVFKIKKSPTDVEHVYDPSEDLELTPANLGEELFRKAQFKEALEYFSTEGVSDADSKIYAAFCLLRLSTDIIDPMESYIQDRAGHAKPSVYNYQEIKEMLETSKMLLDECKLQDSSREALCNENLAWVGKQMGRLEAIEADLKHNSFGNMLLRAVAEGVVSGIANGLTRSVNRAIDNVLSPLTSSSNTGGSGMSNTSSFSSGSSSSSYSESSSESSSGPVSYRDCSICKGDGDILTTSTVGTYGNDHKTTCSTCGEEHWASTVHHHKRCSNCNGTGKVPK